MKITITMVLIFLTATIYFIASSETRKTTEQSKSSSQHSQPTTPVNTNDSTEKVNELLRENKKQAIKIFRQRANNQPQNPTSYLGGQPTLPEGINWPKNQHFVAQIDLSSIPKNELLPNKGDIF